MRDFKGFIRLGRHLMSAACLLFVLAATTNAYSIVMRGGKRIEIPDKFNVTNMTVTYETAPGFWITLQMAAIDIPATERANNEAPGSLLRRAIKKQDAPDTPGRAIAVESKASRSVTNRELESYERLRLESERAYEQKLKEMGLPPLAVLRAQAADEAERFWQEMARKRAEAEANERAAQLQAQLAVLNAQLNQIQALLDQPSLVSPDGFTVFGGVPFFGFGRSKVNPLLFKVSPGVPIGGAFGTFHVPFFGFPHRFHGRRNVFIAPGTHVRRQMGFRGRGHGGRRSH